MDRIKIYKPPDGPAQAADFIEGLEPKLRDKLVRQIFYLSRTPLPELREPHYKHFSIEKYQSLYYQHDVTTGADGTVTIQVDPGTYRITEKDVPEPYCLPEDEADRVQTVSLNPNDNKTLTFKNSKKPLLTISKTDADTGKHFFAARQADGSHRFYGSNGP